ncbi:glycosyltransferase [uncultured Flavobacterium sp.]|uniref:glycosyltransferase n=1 Tax=uncultured Flavobacterium sp. TaxID=165435 RepID=UPI00292CEFF7|nr:glycosyltransferase [uncultured Flavobacterium sp.]
MKVLHITTSCKGGAGIAALRLHEALCTQGVFSGYLSANLAINFNNVIIVDDFFKYKKPAFLKKMRIKFQKHFPFTRFQKSVQRFNSLKENMEFEMATLPFSIYKLHKHPLVQEADIINLHWTGGILDYSSFFAKCQKPIVWTLHDMNPFQGLFHYKNDELRNSKIGADFDFEMKKIKRKAIRSIKNGAIVSPSKWLLKEAKKSNVFIGFNEEYIPNAIDLELFKIQDKEKLRKRRGIESYEFVVLFVSDSLKNYRKGFDLLTEALLHLKNLKVTVLAIGKGEILHDGDLKIIALGEINSPLEMAECYGMADVFILPSREDNLPNVMLESFACGTPIVGFAIGGIAEHTVDSITGVLAEDMTAQSLAKAIDKFYQTKNNYKDLIVRKYAEENFSLKRQADSYISLYEKVLNKNKVEK